MVFDRAKDIQTLLGLPLFYIYKEGTAIRLAVSEYDIKENRLLKILRSEMFRNSEMKIPLAIGYNLMGNMHIADLAKLQHLVIVGPSGTGKSVALKCIVTSILVRCTPNAVKLLMFDIGANSLTLFNDVAHLHFPIVKDTDEGVKVLESLVWEMDRRIDIGEDECQSLPYLVCIIDEFDDTIASIEDKHEAKRFTDAINSVIRRGRKAKIIIILASHDPTLKNTKVNINGIVPRIVFQTLKHHGSSTAGVSGAESLPGEGAMHFRSQAGQAPTPLQGSFVTDAEIVKLLSYAPPDNDEHDMLEIKEPVTEFLPSMADGLANSGVSVKRAEKELRELADIIMWVLGRETISSRKIQECFRIGGKRADTIVDKLNQMGIIGDKNSNQPRKVIPTCYGDLSEEIMGFLNEYGYTEEQIVEAFNVTTLVENLL